VIVYPAIDIRGGRCVRLVEGDFNRETEFAADPADAARRWAEAGAEWIHIVDLDGAVAGEPVNVDAIRRIVAAIDIPVQLGGGMRSLQDVQSAFSLGVERVIIGTKAITDQSFVTGLVEVYGANRIAIGLDARDGKLAGAGWLEQSDVAAVEVAGSLVSAGLRHVIYTDIRRDGTLTGPNLSALAEIIAVSGSGVIASGGIGSLADVEAVGNIGSGGVIIGRALYDARIELAQAITIGSAGVPVS
jgi:phosphoribosylformimino-5-aminoimidazole carboxamide ribotide isomerase